MILFEAFVLVINSLLLVKVHYKSSNLLVIFWFLIDFSVWREYA